MIESLVLRIHLEPKKPQFLFYYKNLNLTERDLTTVGLAIRILKYIIQYAKQELIDMNSNMKYNLSQFLQKISKIGIEL